VAGLADAGAARVAGDLGRVPVAVDRDLAGAITHGAHRPESLPGAEPVHLQRGHGHVRTGHAADGGAVLRVPAPLHPGHRDDRRPRVTTYRPVSGLDSPRFVGIRTFMRLPHVPTAEGCDAFIVGIPFDTGATYRVGARFGPEAIRSISVMLRPYHPTHRIDICERIDVADAGDLNVKPGFAEPSFQL